MTTSNNKSTPGWHTSPSDGKLRKCANIHNCDFGSVAEHGSTKEEAKANYEAAMEKKFDNFFGKPSESDSDMYTRAYDESIDAADAAERAGNYQEAERLASEAAKYSEVNREAQRKQELVDDNQDDGGWGQYLDWVQDTEIDDEVESSFYGDKDSLSPKQQVTYKNALRLVDRQEAYDIAEELIQIPSKNGEPAKKLSDVSEKERQNRIRNVAFSFVSTQTEESYLEEAEAFDEESEKLQKISGVKEVSGPFRNENMNDDLKEDVQTSQLDFGGSLVNFDRVSSGLYNPNQADKYLQEKENTYQSRYEMRSIREDGLANDPKVISPESARFPDATSRIEYARAKLETSAVLGGVLQKPKTYSQYKNSVQEEVPKSHLAHDKKRAEEHLQHQFSTTDPVQFEAHCIAQNINENPMIKRGINSISSEPGQVWNKDENRYEDTTVYKAYDRNGKHLFSEHSSAGKGSWADNLNENAIHLKTALDNEGFIDIGKFNEWSKNVAKTNNPHLPFKN